MTKPLTAATIEELARDDARIRELWRGSGPSHMLPERTDDEEKELVSLLRKQHDAFPVVLAAARRVAELEVRFADAMELVAEYEAQWGDEYLAKKWGLRALREGLERGAASEAEGGGR